MTKRATREVVVFPYTVVGSSHLDNGSGIEMDMEFSASVEIDEDEFARAFKNRRLRHWRIETPGDLAVYKVETLLDKKGFDCVEITACEGDETRKKTVYKKEHRRKFDDEENH